MEQLTETYEQNVGMVDDEKLLNSTATEDKQYRKFFITQLNPQEYGLEDPDLLKKKIQNECKCKYACFCYEEAPSTGTRHFHLYIEYHDARRFKTLHNLFPHAHIQVARGDVLGIRDYITKTGKYAETEASEYNDRSTFREIGTTDAERKRQTNNRNIYIMNELRKGKKPLEVIDENPELFFKGRQLTELSQMLRFDQVPNYRDVETIYICGNTGVGKTSLVYEEHEGLEVCRITHYPPRGDVKFDNYTGQKVLVFEEFRSQIGISSMLNYLDNYKIWLPARYSDKVSVYDKVYITSNWRLDEQYQEVQKLYPLTWQAFIRRIDKVRVFTGKGEYTEYKVRLDERMKLIYEPIGSYKTRWHNGTL